MNLAELFDNLSGSIIDLATSNPIIAIIVLIVLAFLAYRRPKLFLLILLLGAVLMGVIYIVSDLSTSGTSKKEGLIEKSVPENSFRTPGLRL